MSGHGEGEGDGRIEVCARNVTDGPNHDHHDDAKRQRDAQRPEGAGVGVDHDGPTAPDHQDHGGQELRRHPACQLETGQGTSGVLRMVSRSLTQVSTLSLI